MGKKKDDPVRVCFRAAAENERLQINVVSELRQSYIQSIGHAYDENHQEANLIAVLTSAKNSVQKKTIEKIKELND
ncbi:hypothetical protein [Enterococcus pallens]|uniref:hypothetical protein n=1 Tax=Enterococcus pallens TaxID=160454 RepID=UPI0003A78285|nr:hypothetical protein [Enterococcus pallens]OJG78818.1 hypothetical protein RV10_GL001304 [Enterococcus pallens]